MLIAITFFTSNFSSSLDRIKNQLINSGIFDRVYALDESFLEGSCLYFCQINRRGYGYWLWKSYIVLKLIHQRRIKKDDIVLYLDGGCQFNKEGKKRFYDYVELAQKRNFVGFEMYKDKHCDKYWCRKSLLNLFESKGEEYQIIGCVWIFKYNSITFNFFIDWYSIATNNNGYYIKDIEEKEDIWFREHRHDQSVFSLLFRKYKFLILDDETYWEDCWDSKLKYPIHVKRLKF